MNMKSMIALACALMVLSAPLKAQKTDVAPPVNDVGVTLNFKDVPVDTVLDYLSKEAGLVIVRKTTVTGTVNLTSHQPLNREEIVELLNSILADKGVTALRNGRILKIIKSSDAIVNDIPIRTGSRPEDLPKSNAIITQIIPVRHGKATEVLANLKPMLDDSSTISSNKSSNAVIMTGTQTNIRKVMTLIRALDMSISSTTAVKVFSIANGDAKAVADVINKAFSSDPNALSRTSGMSAYRSRPSSKDSSAAGAKVSAVAEERSNSVIVNAQEDMMVHVELLIKEIDVPTKDAAKIEVFSLKYADAEETAAKIIELFSTGNKTQNNNPMSRSARYYAMMRGRLEQSTSISSSKGGRQLQEAEVNAVADVRTNAVIVTASENTMAMVRSMINRLDATPEKIPQVYVYKLKNADMETVKKVLENMFEDFKDSSTTTRSGATGKTGTGSSNNQRGNSPRPRQ